MNKVYNIAVLGSGPAGISTAVEAKYAGIDDVVLFEKEANYSSMIRTYYKDGKRIDKDYKGIIVELKGHIDFYDNNKEKTLEIFDNLLKEHSIDLRLSTNIEKVEKSGDTFKLTSGGDVYEAKNVVICIGNMGKPNKPDYKIPSKIKAKVNYNVQKCGGDEKILVVGGGNSAVEYAYDLRLDNDITLNYRKTEFTRANDINVTNISSANSSGELKLKVGIDITSLEQSEDNIKVNFTDGVSEEFERVVYAIGGVSPVDFLRSCGIELGDKDIAVFDGNYETNVKGIYVAGDLAKGGSICAGFNHSYDIVQHIKSKL